MEFLKKALPVLEKFLVWVSPKRALMLALFVLVLIVSMTLFEQRGILMTAVEDSRSKPPIFGAKIALTKDTQEAIKALVDRNPDIVFATVVSADIRYNHQDLLFYYTDDQYLKILFQSLIDVHGQIQPLFSASSKENEQIVMSINGEFGCFKFSDTSFSRLIPDAGPLSQVVCRISLPPYYGEFAGFMAFGLKNPPGESRLDELRHESTRLATDIYFKNFRF